MQTKQEIEAQEEADYLATPEGTAWKAKADAAAAVEIAAEAAAAIQSRIYQKTLAALKAEAGK